MPDSPKNPCPLPLIPAFGPWPGSGASRRPGSGASRRPGSGASRSAGSASRGATRLRPLPDAHAIRACLVPQAAPPYDDAAAADAVADDAERERRAAAWRIAEYPTEPNWAQPMESGPWPSHFAQVLAETLAGSRPARQIRPWTTEQARKRINELGQMLSAARQPRVRRVIVSSPAHGVLEMTVIVDFGARARAVAVRLERPPSPSPDARPARQPPIRTQNPRPAPSANWLCTAIEAA
jgi:hypothetical protein